MDWWLETIPNEAGGSNIQVFHVQALAADTNRQVAGGGQTGFHSNHYRGHRRVHLMHFQQDSTRIVSHHPAGGILHFCFEKDSTRALHALLEFYVLATF